MDDRIWRSENEKNSNKQIGNRWQSKVWEIRPSKIHLFRHSSHSCRPTLLTFLFWLFRWLNTMTSLMEPQSWKIIKVTKHKSKNYKQTNRPCARYSKWSLEKKFWPKTKWKPNSFHAKIWEAQTWGSEYTMCTILFKRNLWFKIQQWFYSH